MYQLPALENDGAELNVLNDSGKYFPRNDQDLREMLRIFVSKNNLKFTVFIETPSKAFSDWSFPKVCQLYGLGESDDPSLSVFPPFTCGIKVLEDDSSQVILKHLIAELNAPFQSAEMKHQNHNTYVLTLLPERIYTKGSSSFDQKKISQGLMGTDQLISQ